jgi:hypothetical protein
VKQGLLTLAGVTLAMAVAMPAHALTNSIQNFNQTAYNLAQAYPCTVGTYPTSEGISDLRVWAGVCGNNNVTVSDGTTFPGATPGLLCLARNGLALDVNCFAVAAGTNVSPAQFGPCFVQAYWLTKQVPGSFKCPDVYGLPHFFVNGDGDTQLQPYTYIQYGTGVRTWWALNFTQPGTIFTLSVVSVCRSAPSSGGLPGPAFVHKDTWTWRVVASPETMAQLIEVMHGGAVSTLEVPCIIGEDMYDALKSAQSNLAGAVASGNTTNIGNAIFDMEALIVSNCLFVDVLDPLQAFPGAQQTFADGTVVPGIQPPGNLAQTVKIGANGSAIAGIIDTIENPCCCKLLVDLEYIAIYNGVIGQVPHLPVIQPGGAYDPDTTGVNGS